MTYFGFLARFLLIPLVIMGALHWRDARQGVGLPAHFRMWRPWQVILAHVVVAMIYTTPWDNYLVATSVWWYDPNLVTGITLGWVPIEEYTFFVLQTVLTGLWVVWLMPRVAAEDKPFTPRPMWRWVPTAVLALIWLISTVVLFSDNPMANYLTLILSWALIPIIIQTAFGGDILRHYGRLMLWGIIPPALYLGAADAVAINAGTWIISPEQTTGILLGGILPLEEFLFFVVTNVLVVLGMTLVMARESHQRAGLESKSASQQVS